MGCGGDRRRRRARQLNASNADSSVCRRLLASRSVTQHGRRRNCPKYSARSRWLSFLSSTSLRCFNSVNALCEFDCTSVVVETPPADLQCGRSFVDTKQFGAIALGSHATFGHVREIGNGQLVVFVPAATDAGVVSAGLAPEDSRGVRSSESGE